MSTVQTPQKTYQLLLVDDDSTVRHNLKEYLQQYHEAPYKLAVDEAQTAKEAIDKLKQSSYDLVICDINLPDEDGFSVLKQASALHPGIKRALITAYDVNTYIEMVKKEKVYNIITKSAPFNFDEISSVINNLLIPDKAFGLDNYLQVRTKIDTYVLKSSNDIITAHEMLKKFFEHHKIENIDAIAVVLMEGLTNSIYHAAKNSDGTMRYEKGQVIEKLAENEQVTVTYAADDEKIGVSIRDQGGSITAAEILYWLERNVSGNSLMDTHGRGMFLIHRLMDRVIINLAPGRATEFILLHYLSQNASENKPIYINEVS